MLWYQSGISRNSGLVTLAQLILLLLIIINNIKLKMMLWEWGDVRFFAPNIKK